VYALGVCGYLRPAMSKLDAFVVLVSWVEIVGDALAAGGEILPIKVSMFRMLRIIRVLKLAAKSDSFVNLIRVRLPSLAALFWG
jgi:hypothetical protein